MHSFEYECGILITTGDFFGCPIGGHGKLCENLLSDGWLEDDLEGSLIFLSDGAVVIEDPNNRLLSYTLTENQLLTLDSILDDNDSSNNLKRCTNKALELFNANLEMGTYRFKRLPKEFH